MGLNAISLSMLVAAASAALQTYSVPPGNLDGVSLHVGAGISQSVDNLAGTEHSSGARPSTSGGHTAHVNGFTTICRDGEVIHVDGTCVLPAISRKVYVYEIPEQPQEPSGPPLNIPPPRVNHNVVFVRLPEEGPEPEPIILPPPRQQSIVYVLNKKTEEGRRVIEVPAHPQSSPEVYFINYQNGENPALPIGIDLETALGSAAAANGLVLGGAGGLSDANGRFGVAGGATGGHGKLGGATGAARDHSSLAFGKVGGVTGAAGSFVAETGNHGGFSGVPTILYRTP
ncbi:uncharacterized protein LOC125038016 [Penaeus chinensis]|uniref:uncharacterized protein LOC125038016 n=1 Tax=Penaeus chinensis TaxID=139456 RepID=UPI001FB5B364|nr:uncharacterized protein LOC125038016 [Penaeus chinensis]